MILHRFNVPITERQAGKIRAQWAKHGKNGAAMAAFQMVISAGPFALSNPHITVAIFDGELAQDINAVLNRHAAKAGDAH